VKKAAQQTFLGPVKKVTAGSSLATAVCSGSAGPGVSLRVRRTSWSAPEPVPSSRPRSMRRAAAVALFVASVCGEVSRGPAAAVAAAHLQDDSPPAQPPLPGGQWQRLAQPASAAAVASYAMTDRCGSAPSGHPTRPMPPSTTAHGVEITFGEYNITVCNNTAWTFRGLWHGARRC
jgi:hypothetical protein